MNLQAYIFDDNLKIPKELVLQIEELKELVINEKIKFSDKPQDQKGNNFRYLNCLPKIPATRDVVKKSGDICDVRINWKKIPIENDNLEELLSKLKEQYYFPITVADVGYKRNDFKNTEYCQIIFDDKKTAEKYLKIFNKMFRTQLELDAIGEREKYKKNNKNKMGLKDKIQDKEFYDAEFDIDELGA